MSCYYRELDADEAAAEDGGTNKTDVKVTEIKTDHINWKKEGNR